MPYSCVRTAAAVAAWVLMPLLCGCAAWRPTPVPMPTIRVPAACETPPDTLLVMLPGRGAYPEDFLREGFVAALRERRIAADVVLADAHLGYYAEKSIIVRLQNDVLAPARARGYRHVWLMGISMGTFGALINTEQYPDGIDGIIALGPYLGVRAAAERINAQGGLRDWPAPSGWLDKVADVDVIVWRWLQAYRDPRTAAQRPAFYLGYGREDRFVFSDDLLAAVLPEGHVFTTEGGHDWPPWIALWRRMLDVLPLPRDASCAVNVAE